MIKSAFIAKMLLLPQRQGRVSRKSIIYKYDHKENDIDTVVPNTAMLDMSPKFAYSKAKSVQYLAKNKN